MWRGPESKTASWTAPLSRIRLSTCANSLGQAVKTGQDARTKEESSGHNRTSYIAKSARRIRGRERACQSFNIFGPFAGLDAAKGNSQFLVRATIRDSTSESALTRISSSVAS
jgi:hypothetical protein